MGKSKPQPVKGTRDFLPAELRRRHHVIDVIRRVYQSYGFEPLETPTLERLDTLSGKYGDEGDQLMFKVLRRGQPLVDGIRKAGAHLLEPGAVLTGRSGETAPQAEGMLADLGLRYDLTVPLARVIAGYQGKLPTIFKRYQIQPVWRADTPGRGRFREFYQCDADVVGADSRVAEAEVAAAAVRCLEALGFSDFRLRINHRGLLRAMIQHVGIASELETTAIVAIDKLDKVGADGVERELIAKGIEAGGAKALMSLLERPDDLEGLKAQLSEHPEGTAAAQDIQEVLALSAHSAAGPRLAFDATLARGLGYYTGCIFELNVPDLAGSLGGGGRYDGLVGMFSGKDVPACGFSLGLERIVLVMEERGMFPEALDRPDVTVAPVKADGLPAAFALSETLRRAGLRVDLRPKGMKPGKLRQYAEDVGIPAAAWLEPEQSDHASLWRHGQGETQRDLPFDALASLLHTAPSAGDDDSHGD